MVNVSFTIVWLVVMICYGEGTTDERLDRIEDQISKLSTLQTFLLQVRDAYVGFECSFYGLDINNVRVISDSSSCNNVLWDERF